MGGRGESAAKVLIGRGAGKYEGVRQKERRCEVGESRDVGSFLRKKPVGR
jgi:hypothetical protein